MVDESEIPLIVPLSGAEPFPVAGALPGDVVAGWGSDGAVYVGARQEERHHAVFRIDPTTSTRELVWEIGPSDLVGVNFTGEPQVSADGSTVVYSVFRELTDLFVVAAADAEPRRTPPAERP